MATVTLKNVPDALMRKLRRQARSSRRSLNQQAILLLERGTEKKVDDEEVRRQRRMSQVSTWLELAGTWDSDETAEEEIRAILDARTGGRHTGKP